jgi:hypothetical protein
MGVKLGLQIKKRKQNESVLELDSDDSIWNWERLSNRTWGKLHNEFHNLYSSSNIIRMIKARNVRWAAI